jgi:enoyl-CoA hydratase/carnithine racemase
MSERKKVFSSVEGHIFLIKIDHTPINTLDMQTLSELEREVDEFTANPRYKVGIISGGDKVIFVSGADISEASEMNASGNIRDFILRGQRILRRIRECSKPVIAAINGLALGGGMELAMACHLRIMADRAKLAQPEINLGIIPGWGGTQMLPKIIGEAKARELILSGESISAQEAFRLNLVNKVVPRKEVLNAAKELARKIAGKSSLAIRAAMDSIRMSTQLDETNGLAHEAEQIIALTGSANAQEGLKAFLEKRQPVFKDE